MGGLGVMWVEGHGACGMRHGVVGSVCVGFVLALPLPLLLLLPLLSLLNVTMVMPSCLGVGARVTPSTPPFASHPAIYSFLFLLFFLYFALQPG